MINPYLYALPENLAKEVRDFSHLRSLVEQGCTGAHSGPLNMELQGIFAAHRFAFLRCSVLNLTPDSHVEDAGRLFDLISRTYSKQQKRPQAQVKVKLILLSFESMWREYKSGLSVEDLSQKYGLSL